MLRISTWATAVSLILGAGMLAGCCSSRPAPSRARVHAAPIAQVQVQTERPVAADVAPVVNGTANGSDASGAPDGTAVLVHFVPPCAPPLPEEGVCATPAPQDGASLPVCVGDHCAIPPAAGCGSFSMTLPGSECCEGGVCGIPAPAAVETPAAAPSKCAQRASR